MRIKVLLIRVVLGLLFAFLLTRLFFPAAGIGMALGIAALLIFFAYLFESVHKRER